MAFTPTTWNPSDKSSTITLSNGNLTATKDAGPNGSCNIRSIDSQSTGKWYWEVSVDLQGYTEGIEIGIGDVDLPLDGVTIGTAAGSNGYSYSGFDGKKRHAASYLAYGNTYTTNAIISIALDLDAHKIWWAKNGVWQASGNPTTGANPAYSTLSGVFYAMISGYNASDALTANFGASAFTYSVPSGFQSGWGNFKTTEFSDLITEIKAENCGFVDFKTHLEACFGGTKDLSTNIKAIRSKWYLKTHLEACFGGTKDLSTNIKAIRSKWELNTEIVAASVARWYFNTEWNPNRFLHTQITAKKYHTFSFKTQTTENYSSTTPCIEFKTAGNSFPLRTLFLDYINVGSANEYPLQIWWARNLTGKKGLKNVKITAEYIDTQYSGGYEVVTCDWLSGKVNGGSYQTINNSPLVLGDISCDSYIDFTLKVDCLDCSLTRGLVFFKLNITGDWQESLYGDSIRYRDGFQYHAGEFDDYKSDGVICRLYVV